ncbi:MAG: DUF4340 domain-containing protein [Bryobacterales bacterium]|nr:DUF4340 domain-containing protein [Bryobacterales bacterium]
MKNQWAITFAFAAAAAALVAVAARVQPETYQAAIFSDQGEDLFPALTGANAVQSIEIVDYNADQAVARPLKVELRKGRWVLASHGDYPAEARDRLAQTAGALVGLKKDAVASDRWDDQAQYGVIDPLDQKNPSLTGRGKRVTLLGAHGTKLAEIVLGTAVPNRSGYRYARIPGQKRIYAVQTAADPSARFEDWVEADLLHVDAGGISRLIVNSYTIDEMTGTLAHVRRRVMTPNGENWDAAARSAAQTLAGLRVAGARAKPKLLAEQLRTRQLALSLETVMSLRARGFFILPNGQLLANAGEAVVETTQGFVYTLRFGEVAGSSLDGEPGQTPAAVAVQSGGDRFLFVTVSSRNPATEARAKALDSKFADWYYIIAGKDFANIMKAAPAGSEVPRAPRPAAASQP